VDEIELVLVDDEQVVVHSLDLSLEEVHLGLTNDLPAPDLFKAELARSE